MTMPITLPGSIVSVQWLAEHLGMEGLVVLDATLKPPGATAAASPADTLQIPGTRVFDFDKRICDPATSLPHMMPSPELFEREVRALGVGSASAVVVYDRLGIFSSPRGWWMFKAMGHERVAVLDGGLPAWLEAGLPSEPKSETRVTPGDFVARPRAGLFCDAERVSAALAERGCVVLDARSEGRFAGRDPEPRPGLRPGHMPNARNLPFSAVLAQGRMRPPSELAGILAGKAKPEQQLVFSCGSGVTACILALAADLAGYPRLSVYDGSWSEWGLPGSSRPVVTE